MSEKTVLSLAELEAFDPHSPDVRPQRRFCCPLCGRCKPLDAKHRCLSVRVADGAWNCKRCAESGVLREHWKPLTPVRAVDALSARLQRAFSIGPLPSKADTTLADTAASTTGEPQAEKWREVWERSRDLDQKAPYKYLQGRSISIEVARASQVRFAPNWHGRSTLVFPLCDPNGEVVAVVGRCLTNGGIDKPGLGPKKNGVFGAVANGRTPFHEALPAVVVCEAPLDALSLATAGFAAIALGGTAPPHWLAQKCAFRRVLIALDADEAGDWASEKLAAMLSSFGARCHRLRPEGSKDWNEMLLEQGRVALGDWLAVQTLFSDEERLYWQSDLCN